MKALGRHIIVELYDCRPELLDDVVFVEEQMLHAAREAEATPINATFHHFSPYGVSGVVVIEESHLAIHTWPEYGFASVDLFTCGEAVDPWICYRILHDSFEAGHGSSMEMQRGSLQLLKKQDYEVRPARPQFKLSKRKEKFSKELWFTERNENIAISLKHEGEKVFSKKSPFQKVEIYDTYAFGRVLALDGAIVATEKDEAAYHEMLVHPAMCTHEHPKNVLIIGGGDGGTIREVLKHDAAEKVTVVELDEVVMQAAQEYLPFVKGVFNDSRIETHIADGVEFIKQIEDQYDLIIVDALDTFQPGAGLFKAEFYEYVRSALNEGGILVVQSESPRFRPVAFQDIHTALTQTFGVQIFTYLAFVAAYPTGMWSFSIYAENSPLSVPVIERVTSFCSSQAFKYYNPEVHRAAFALPNFIHDELLS